MKQWSSRLRAMWLSVLSWMRWSQRRTQRRWEEEQRLLLQMRLQQRMLLMEALTPMAEALQRLDNLQRTAAHQQHKHQQYQEELLQEILNSLQPPASQQIFPPNGQPPLTSIFPSSGS